MKTVGIIGGSGFIGSYVTRKFLMETYFTQDLKEQKYKVRVSATDISKSEKYLHLICLPNSKNLKIIPLDVLDQSSLKEFVAGCDILVHCGTPFRYNVVSPEKELFEPTVKGTENLLDVITQTPGLSKVIFVGSISAYNTNFPLPASNRPPSHQYTEADVPFLSEESNPYNQAKYFADQLVRKYLVSHQNTGTEIVTVAPVFVTGKAISERTDSTSIAIQSLIKNKTAAHPLLEMYFDLDTEFAVVDVSDVAESIYKAAVLPNLHGKHYLLSSESWAISDLSRMLNNEQPIGTSKNVVNGKRATIELGVHFRPFHQLLNTYA